MMPSFAFSLPSVHGSGAFWGSSPRFVILRTHLFCAARTAFAASAPDSPSRAARTTARCSSADLFSGTCDAGTSYSRHGIRARLLSGCASSALMLSRTPSTRACRVRSRCSFGTRCCRLMWLNIDAWRFLLAAHGKSGRVIGRFGAGLCLKIRAENRERVFHQPVRFLLKHEGLIWA